MRAAGPAARARRALLGLAIAALLLSSCADPRVNVLILWHSFSGARERALLALIDQFNQQNRSGSIVVAQRREAATLRGAMLDGKASGAEPALTMTTPPAAALLRRNGLARALDDLIALPPAEGGFSADDRADLFAYVFRAGQSPDGTTSGIGYGGAARAFYYNRDWLRSEGFDAPPADLDRFATVCGRASDTLKGTQCLISSADAATYQDWLYMFGGSLTAPSRGSDAPQLASAPAITATSRLAIFANAGLLRRALNDQQPRDEFAAGRSLFSLDWTDQLFIYRAQVKDNAGFEWGIASPPTQGGAVQTAWQGWVLTVTPGPAPRELAAWRFIRWMLEEAQTDQWSARTRELPARASALPRLRARDGVDAATVTALTRLARAATPPPAVAGWTCADAALEDAMAEIFEGRPASDALDRAQTAAIARATQFCPER